MQKAIDDPRLVPLLILLASLGVLGAAYASEIWGGLLPCVLCHYQRYVYAAAAGLGLVALLAGGRPAVRRLVVGLAGLTFLSGTAIAGFHVGVEQHWWRGTAGCHAPAFDMSLPIEQLREAMLATNFVPCDEVRWSLFGLSLAGYNVFTTLALGLGSLWAAKRMAGGHAA